MELIVAVLVAGPLGHLCRSRRLGLGLYLLIWAVVFPIQTIAVSGDSSDGIDALYFVVNAVILAFGIGLNTLGARLRARRDARRSVARG